MWLSYYKPLKDVYDFSGDTAVLTVTEHQLKRVYKSINFYRNHADVGRDLERIKLALKLLEIILEDKHWGLDNGQWKCYIKVNTRNAYRFNKRLDTLLKKDCSNPAKVLHTATLYTEKAWYLYHKLMYLHLRDFWD